MSTRPSLGLEPSHTVVFVHDLDRMVEFYTEELGFEVADRGPVGDDEVAFLSQGVNHHQLALVTGRTSTGKSDTVDHTAYHSGCTLGELKELWRRLDAHPDVTEVRPTTHGNTWSVYFQDPENNGVEVYVDTPWHVTQPQIETLDLTKSDEEILTWTRETFQDRPGFEPVEAFHSRRLRALGR
jgi:catechol 2,3-dioxygenase